MKRVMGTILMTSLIVFLLLSHMAWAAGSTKLYKIRLGQHPGFTRLVFDTEGARPLRIGPADADEVNVVYEQLNFAAPPDRLFRKLRGAVTRVSHQRLDGQSVLTITFRRSDTEVKTFYLPAEPPKKGLYRLVLDFYPGGSTAAGPGTRVPIQMAETEKAAPVPTPDLAQKPEPVVRKAEPPEKSEMAAEEKTPEKEEEPSEVTAEAPSAFETLIANLSGEASVLGRPLRSGDDESSKFTEYSDLNPVTGEWDLKYEKENEYRIETDAQNIGQDDQYYSLGVNQYGKFKAGVSYNEIPHRYTFGVKTLYSGVGSGNLTLPDSLQSDLQNGVITIDQAFNNAVSGDPEFDRKTTKLNFDWLAKDPFSFRTEFSYEKQDGSRPMFGSFGTAFTTVELFEPIDNETYQIKLIAEYAKLPFFLNATYQYSNFKNNENTLIFDNPFRATDALLGPSRGRIDLAPDNDYHNASVSGSYTDLPFKGRISGTAAWGWMRQNDDLIPYTINTAIAAPPLPNDSADAEVKTSLYNVLLSARPTNKMHVKGRFRYYEYDNDTQEINFPGFVSADDFFDATPIVNQPVSYKKMRAKTDLGYDVWKRSRLNLGYTYDRIEQTNREVDNIQDHIFSGAIDTNPSSWLSLKASYERTERDISNYDFDVYLGGGLDLEQLAGLRKYTEADVSRDRVQFMANVFPVEPLAFSGSFIYGRDDFDKSAFGLTDDEHYILSLDADYALTDRLHLNAFYSYEKYENTQKGFGEFDGGPDTDWDAKGRDVINTAGGGIKFGIIPDRLDFDISYSYSKVDGNIDFNVPGGGAVDWDSVDETELHILDTKLSYHIWKGCFLTLGYVYEKFKYDDYNVEGFTHTPTDAILAGTLPQDYTAHIGYMKLTYKFNSGHD
ncbi:MAG: MtrB/PioB family decaheme-associated outer membrane protein [Desulfobacterales bacterium]